MKPILRPKKLKKGDVVAAVSLSWGGAGEPELRWRYELGKRRIEEAFGVRVVEAPHALKGADWLRRRPEARAEDLMWAFSNPEVNAVFSCIGGDDSIRLFPHTDLHCIAENPKIFLGYSDSTITHLICRKAGLVSFYGPSILAEFAENIAVFDYTLDHLRRALSPAPLGDILPSPEWTGEILPWTPENAGRAKAMRPNTPYQVLQGQGAVRGRLIGGCLEVLDMARGTPLFPDPEDFEGAILLLETSEDMPPPANVSYMLRALAACGVLRRLGGIFFAKPCGGVHEDAYHAALRQVLAEDGLADLPVLANGSFGHNEPMCTLPLGVMAEMSMEEGAFRVLEAAVQ